MVGAPDTLRPLPHLGDESPKGVPPYNGLYTINNGKANYATADMVSLNKHMNGNARGDKDTEKGDPSLKSPGDLDAHAPLPEYKEEKWWSTLLQVGVPFFIAGVGTIGAGLVLGIVENWRVYQSVSAIFVLIPSLSGLKGNLDMCLASRLSTQANLGNMKSVKEVVSMVVGNISLVQIQAIVAATIVAIFAVVVNVITDRSFSIENSLLLTASAVFTATTTCFVLDFVMVLVIIMSNKINMNPDNLATPLAASIGDIVSITTLSVTASYLYDQICPENIEDMNSSSIFIPIVMLIVYAILLPMWVWVVLRNSYTRSVLTTGWVPVISALFISGLGGMVLDQAVDKFHGFVLFQPIVNGIGGNLVSVQSSRISTSLHQRVPPGVLPEGTKILEYPWKALFYGTSSAKIARMLICLSVPGQVLFMFAADYLYKSITTIHFPFAISYLICTLLHVMVLLYAAHVLVHFMWKRKIDPDNSAIPYLTALGDLLGSVFLALAFIILMAMGRYYADGSL